MRKQILTLGAICAAAFTLTNCNKEIAEPQAPVTGGTDFEIIATTADTKTANNGLNTVWATGDDLTVFHAVAGSTTYGSNDKFTYSGADNKFTGKLATGLDASKSYDWYALYPYNKLISDPTGKDEKYTLIGKKNGTDAGDTQDGNDSKAHLIGRSCPMYATAKNIQAADVPAFTMKHLTSVVAVTVTNDNNDPLTVNSVSFSAPEGTLIFGSFYINFTENGDAVYTKHTNASYTSNTTNLTVKNGTPIAKGGKATFYLAIKPFAANTGDELKISVNGYEKTHKLTKNVEFKAGKIEAVNFKYDKPAPSGFATTYTSNVTMTAGDNSSKAKVIIGGTEYDAVKAGTKNGAGKLSIKIPAGTTKLHIHAAGWGGDSSSFTIEGATVSDKTITPISDSGISGSGTTFTLTGDPTNYYKELTLTGVTAETTLTITAKKASKCRFVIFGVNAE